MKIAYHLTIATQMGIEAHPEDYLKSIGVTATNFESGDPDFKGEIRCDVDRLPDPMPVFIKEVTEVK